MLDVERPDRDFDKLHPLLQRSLLDLFQECGRHGIAVFMGEGFRPAERQAWLFASGRERKGPILTNARPGQSYHNLVINGRPCAAGADFAIWDEDKPWSKSLEWNGTEREWQIFTAAARKVGLKTLSFEKPHVQLPHDLEALKALRFWPQDLMAPGPQPSPDLQPGPGR